MIRGFARRVRPLHWIALASTLALCCAGAYAVLHEKKIGADRRRKPRVILWAWERPVDLRSIDTDLVGVAYLVSTLVLRDRTVTDQPRVQPLRIREGTYALPVIRIESDGGGLPCTSEVLSAIDRILRDTHSPSLQLDFDARKSERAFYRDLLTRLGERHPTLDLSITALASWCIGDPWIDSLPVREAVPMLFRMGRDEQMIQQYLNHGGKIRSRIAEANVGLALDEPVSPDLHGKTLYVFNPGPWNDRSIARVMTTLAELQ